MKWDASRVVAVLVGAVVFGVLMELRAELGGTWARALVAAGAGAVLGLAIVFAQNRK